MGRRAERSAAADRAQLALFGGEREPVRRKKRYVHRHSPDELAAFDRTLATVYGIRPDWLQPDERLCPGECGKVIRGKARHCGRRWCDAVRRQWGSSFRRVITAALDAYCGLYGEEAKVLQGVITCTAQPWWWDRSRCSHGPEVECSGPRGCRVLPDVEAEQRVSWPARKRDALNSARTRAIRVLQRAGYQAERWPNLLVWVVEDQQRGLPHLHFVLGHTTALEKAFAKAFFSSLKRSCPANGLGHSSTYDLATLEQGRYQAGRLRGYVTKLAGYLAKGEEGAAFLRAHSGERVFYVAPWLSALSGVTMTIARLCRRVWAARRGYCEMPAMSEDQGALVERLLGTAPVPLRAP